MRRIAGKAVAAVMGAALAVGACAVAPGTALAHVTSSGDALSVEKRASWQADGEAVKVWSLEELKTLASSSGAAGAKCAAGDTIISSKASVSLQSLLSGVPEWERGSVLTFDSALLAPSYTLTYSDAVADGWFYPGAVYGDEAARGKSTAVGASKVPAAIVLPYHYRWKSQWGKTYGEASSGSPELISMKYALQRGMSSEADAPTALPVGFESLTVVYDNPVATVEDAEYTGGRLYPKVSVSTSHGKLEQGRDFEVSYEDNTEVGYGTASVRYKGTYVGSETLRFRIGKATQDVSLKKTAVNIKRGKSAKLAVETAMPAEVGFAKADGDKAVKVSGSGRIAVSKSARKGAYTVKVKVTAAETEHAKKTTATVPVRVTVR